MPKIYGLLVGEGEAECIMEWFGGLDNVKPRPVDQVEVFAQRVTGQAPVTLLFCLIV